jgi:DNA-binding Lrp family transcriptional regulator
MSEQRQWTGTWIPREIWANDSMSWLEKCLWAEISNLDDNRGCFASNEYLAQKMDSSPASIANMISKMRKAGLIVDCGFDGRRRFIKAINPQVKPALTQPLSLPSSPSEPCFNPPVSIDNRGEKRGENSLKTPIVPLGQVVGEIAPEQVYAAYPLKVARGAALKAIAKALAEARKTDGGAAAILRATMDYAEATAKWAEADRKFIPHPATWFNRQSYTDDPETWKRKSGKHAGTSARIAAALGYQDGM